MSSRHKVYHNCHGYPFANLLLVDFDVPRVTITICTTQSPSSGWGWSKTRLCDSKAEYGCEKIGVMISAKLEMTVLSEYTQQLSVGGRRLPSIHCKAADTLVVR